MSHSSTKTKYHSLAVTSVEHVWLLHLFCELHISFPSPPTLSCDNIRAMFLSSNLVFHAHTKQIKIDCHFVCEHVASKTLPVCFICSKDQLVDIFTKGLATPGSILIRSNLTVLSSLVSLWADVNISRNNSSKAQLDNISFFSKDLPRCC